MDSDRIITQRPYVPSRPAKSAEDESKRLEEVFDQIPLIKQSIEHFDKRIAETDSIKSARALSGKYNLSVDDMSVVLEIVHDVLVTERNWMNNRVKGAKQIQERRAQKED